MNEKVTQGGRRFLEIGVRPFVAPFVLFVFSLLASLFPAPFLLDRAAVQSGELWRLWSGHFVHATLDHFAFDVGLGMLVVAFVRIHPRLLLLPPFVGAAVLGLRPDIGVYTGLSGVLHGLTALATVDFVRRGVGGERVVAALLLAGLLGKALLEAGLGVSLFTSDFDMGVVLYEAHLAGVLGGLLLCAATLVRGPRGSRGGGRMLRTCDAR